MAAFPALPLRQLINRLQAVSGPKARIFAAGSEPQAGTGCALQVQGAGVQVLLEPLSWDFLSALNFEDDVLSALPGFPSELKLAALESLLQPELEALSPLLHTELEIQQYVSSFDKAQQDKCYGSLHCELQVQLHTEEQAQAEAAATCTLPLRLYFVSEEAVHTCYELSLQLPVAADISASALHNPPQEVCFMAGSTVLTVKELRSLREGDALRLDIFYPAQDKMLLVWHKMSATAAAKDGKLTLTAAFGPAVSGRKLMSEQKVTDVTAVQLEVQFELDRQTMSLAELQNLGEGSVLALHNTDLSAVRMMLSGQCVAKGRIIDVGSGFAFQITELARKNNG